MDVTKLKAGQSYNYRTPRGTTGRGKLDKMDETATGWWVTLIDKTRNKVVTVRPGMLTR